MMKIKYITIFVALLLLGSCQSDFLDTVPYDKIGSGNMWKNENLVDLGVNGVYNTLRYRYVGKERWSLDGDGFVGMGRDRTSWILGSSTFKSGVITAGDRMFTNYWEQHYEGIHRANDALLNLEAGVPVSDAKAARLIAEVKFLRAYFYFNLNQVFKGVPIYLEPVPEDQVNRSRDTEAAVWKVVIDDLTDCIDEANLPDMYPQGDSNIGRATKAAAYSLRGKAYLYMKDYKNAEADFKKVSTLGPELYQGRYADLFKEENESHPEMIFSVQNISLSGMGSITQKYLGSSPAFGAGWNTYLPHVDYVESFENADGSPFNWDDYLPGYSTMTPAERTVFFLRDNLTSAQITTFEGRGAKMSLYLPNGNEARVLAAYSSRDPRLAQTIITPYSTFDGAAGNTEFTYTLRWPYVGYDRTEPFDFKTNTNNKFYYLWRKWVYEGTSSIDNREYGPTDMPLIRYADVLLMLAEAINEQGFKTEAVDIVNQVRKRAGAALLQTTDSSLPTFVDGQEDMRERIRNERRWELPVEGINLFDEMRWKTLKEKSFYTGSGAKEIWGTNSYNFSWKGDYIYNWAIPRVETERNSDLKQNPGWE